ncbi:MAG TPA: hypothetical protein VKD72_39695 [Gemmataceae bacterium]|nr:hypothetical protein [Gemmataceae bacterium]
MKTPRNRIKRHVRVRAGELVPHELNARVHSPAQRAALAALYEEIGFARSLLAYELPDGRLKLIDGHLRASMDPKQMLEVEVLDVNDAEARTLLLAIDPLAQLAEYEAATLSQLRALVEPNSAAVRQIWDAVAGAGAAVKETLEKARQVGQASSLPCRQEGLPEQFLVLIQCASEAEQTALLERFRAEGLTCKALVS